MKTSYFKFFLFLSVTLLLGCNSPKDKTTTLEIVDNKRHYYPIKQGQDLEVSFEIKNIGEHPFILSDIIISCGCLKQRKSSIRTISAGKEGWLVLDYDSNKNIGDVKHYITLYGNLTDTNRVEIVFDVHVVPDALYTKDYEELYLEKRKKNGNIKGMVEGEENNRGYYMDEDF